MNNLPSCIHSQPLTACTACQCPSVTCLCILGRSVTVYNLLSCIHSQPLLACKACRCPSVTCLCFLQVCHCLQPVFMHILPALTCMRSLSMSISHLSLLSAGLSLSTTCLHAYTPSPYLHAQLVDVHQSPVFAFCRSVTVYNLSSCIYSQPLPACAACRCPSVTCLCFLQVCHCLQPVFMHILPALTCMRSLSMSISHLSLLSAGLSLSTTCLHAYTPSPYLHAQLVDVQLLHQGALLLQVSVLISHGVLQVTH